MSHLHVSVCAYTFQAYKTSCLLVSIVVTNNSLVHKILSQVLVKVCIYLRLKSHKDPYN